MRNEPNPFIGKNYIPDNVRMAVPPKFWLQRLYDFDDKLVLVPSRHIPFAYVLARRKQLTAGITDKAFEDTIDQPDTKMCFQYGLVPVSIIYRTGEGWSIDNILRELKARDMWAVGGAEKMADIADAADKAERERIRKSIRDDMYARSGDAWRSYQARTGQRNHR